MQKTKIEWATHTWNPAVGCSKVSAGCKNCYAEAMVHRFPGMTGTYHEPGYPEYTVEDLDPIGWDGRAHFKPERLEEPFRLRAGKDRPHRIFVCSMSDLFHETVTNEQIAAVFGVMAATPQHQYFVLTKRPDRAVEWFEWVDATARMLHPKSDQESTWWRVCTVFQQAYDLGIKTNDAVGDADWPLPNVTIGVSVEDMRTIGRVDDLVKTPAAKRFISFEPLLEYVFVDDWEGIDWSIVGAETGPGKRPFEDWWALDLLKECREWEVPFFFKKDGAGNPTLCGVEYREGMED